MKKAFLFLLVIVICSVFTSCGVKYVRFTKKELAWFDVYNLNDTLIFQNVTTQEKDTTIIISKKRYHDPDLYLHQNIIDVAELKYSHTNYQIPHLEKTLSMFHISKWNPDEKGMRYGLDYLNSGFILTDSIKLKQEMLPLTNRTFSEVYELGQPRKNYHPDWENTPEFLFWDKKYGIIKYITSKGEIWERVNWK